MQSLTKYFASIAQSEVAPHPEGECRADKSCCSQSEHSAEVNKSALKQSKGGSSTAEDEPEACFSVETAEHLSQGQTLTRWASRHRKEPHFAHA